MAEKNWRQRRSSGSASSVLDGFIDSISRLKNVEYLINIFLLFFLLAPGMLVLLYFKQAAFLSLDFLKIILVCLTYSLPFIGLYIVVEFGTSLFSRVKLLKRIDRGFSTIAAKREIIANMLSTTPEGVEKNRIKETLKTIDAEANKIRDLSKQILTPEDFLKAYDFRQPFIVGGLFLTVITGLAVSVHFVRADVDFHRFLRTMLAVGVPLVAANAVLMNNLSTPRHKAAAVTAVLIMTGLFEVAIFTR